MFSDLTIEALPGVHILPVVHGRVDMGSITRGVLESLNPSFIAVEIPTSLRNAASFAVRRLPQMSLIVSQEADEDALVWAVTPADPFAVAIRWALERHLIFRCIDPDVRYADRHNDPVPDPYAAWELGPRRYLELLTEVTGQGPVSSVDALRESGMAFHIQAAREEMRNQGALLVLVGAAHVHRLAERLDQPTALPLARVERSRIDVVNLHPDDLTALLVDPPLAHAIFEHLRGDEPLEDPDFEQTVAQRLSLMRSGLRLISGQPEERRAQRLKHVASWAARRAVREGRPDRVALSEVVWRIGSASYTEQTQEAVQPWQRRLFFDYLRRYTRVQSMLVPGLFEWVVSARGVGDDNLAWEIFDVARTYPWQSENAEIPTARIDGDMLDLGSRRIHFRRRFFSVKQRLVQLPVHRVQSVVDPQEWLDGFLPKDGVSFGLCSYPPEDLVIEDYGRFLQSRAESILSLERSRTEPFSTSMLDGIDIRETLRNIHENRIFVRELRREPGGAGSVVVIFDRDLEGGRYPYQLTWLGEHNQESDMAFYATNPGEQVVGPGITRSTYGGFMMTMPPGRVFDVWRDPDYELAREKAEVLLMAAIDYSNEKVVVHVAKDAPSEQMRHYASMRAKRIIHIPIGSLSPITVKKIRVVHLLAGYDKREIAKDFIW
jgi:hypothetical protein